MTVPSTSELSGGVEPRRAPSVVLVRPLYPGNLGSTARAMANTGLDDLRLVEPAVAVDSEARALAVGAVDLLERARRFPSLAEAVASCEVVIGTSSARDRAIGRSVRSPRELAGALASESASAGPAATALVFGSEVSGLNNDELALCTHLVSIPASPKQPTYNLSQAVLILGYEAMLAHSKEEEEEKEKGVSQRPDPPLDRAEIAEVEGLFEHLAATLERVGFSRDDTFDSVLRDLRALAARSQPTRREVKILRGILRRISNTVARSEGSVESSIRPDQ